VPVMNSHTPTVNVSVPVPTPVAPAPRQPAPAPVRPQPVPTGGVAPAIPPAAPPMAQVGPHAFILPWVPPVKKQVPQVMKRVVRRYALEDNRHLTHTRSHTHAEFLRAIEENPSEHTIPLVYADWLEEQGKPHSAAFVRAHTESIRRQYGDGPLNWRFRGTGRYTPLDSPDAQTVASFFKARSYVGHPTPNAVELWQRSEDDRHVQWKLYDQTDDQAHDWMARLASEGAHVPTWITESPEFRRAVRRLNPKPKRAI
jgi:uncharacterized protein (TIGR02996 family)